MNMVQYGTQSEPFEKALGDLNNDSHVDAVVVNFVSSTMSIFRGYGNGTFAPQVTISTGTHTNLGRHC